LGQRNVCQIYLHIVKKSEQGGQLKILAFLETGFTFIRWIKI